MTYQVKIQDQDGEYHSWWANYVLIHGVAVTTDLINHNAIKTQIGYVDFKSELDYLAFLIKFS